MKAYAFLYNPDIHESAPATISVHLSEKGAQEAMGWHKHELEKQHREKGYDFPFGEYERWMIKEIEILP